MSKELVKLARERSLQVSPFAKTVANNQLNQFVCKSPIREELPSLVELTIFKLRNMHKQNQLPPNLEEILPQECIDKIGVKPG